MIFDALTPGGVLIFQSFIGGKNSAYCLQPNELLHTFNALRIVCYQETQATDSDKFDIIVSLVGVKTP